MDGEIEAEFGACECAGDGGGGGFDGDGFCVGIGAGFDERGAVFNQVSVAAVKAGVEVVEGGESE